MQNQTYTRLRLKSPLPVKEYEAGKTKIFVYSTEAEAAYASAINVLINQADTVDKKGTASIMLMAAPSAYKFYKYYFNISKSSKILQYAVKNTHYFQMDEYILPEEHPASFKYLLKHNLFDYLERFLNKEKIHYFYININNVEKSCTEYIELIIKKGLDILVKGQGEDGHWGYHQPGTPFGNKPSIIEVELNNMNISQQLRDHPGLFKSINDPPKVAYSGNVALFMETKNLIEDIVPQQTKAYAVVASYGNAAIDPACPSGKLKEHNNVVFIAIFAAIILKERIRLAGVAGIILAVAGVVLVTFNQGFNLGNGSGNISILGCSFSLLAALSAALYSVIGKKVLAQNDPLIITAFAIFSGTVLLTILTASTVGFSDIAVAGWQLNTIMVVLGLTMIGVAYPLWFICLKKFPASQISIYTYLTPVFAVILSLAILKEKFSWLFWVGGGLILLGIIITNTFSSRIASNKKTIS